MNYHLRKYGVITGICLSVVTMTAGQASAASASGGSGCFVRDGVIDSVATFHYTDVPPAGLSVGDIETVTENIYYPAGIQVGTDNGIIVIANEDSNGDFWAASHVVLHVFGGVIDAHGYGDLTAELEGKPTSVHAIGLSGPFAGKVGTISWVDTSQTTADATYTLCAPAS